MNIRGALFDRIGEDQVDKLDNRSVFTGPLQFTGVNFIIVINNLKINIIKVAHDIVKRRALIVIFVDSRLDGVFGRDNDFDVIAGHKLDIVDGEDIGRIGHGDDQRRACPVDRNQLILLHDFGRNQLDDAFIDFKFTEVDRRDAVLT